MYSEELGPALGLGLAIAWIVVAVVVVVVVVVVAADEVDISAEMQSRASPALLGTLLWLRRMDKHKGTKDNKLSEPRRWCC